MGGSPLLMQKNVLISTNAIFFLSCLSAQELPVTFISLHLHPKTFLISCVLLNPTSTCLPVSPDQEHELPGDHLASFLPEQDIYLPIIQFGKHQSDLVNLPFTTCSKLSNCFLLHLGKKKKPYIYSQ